MARRMRRNNNADAVGSPQQTTSHRQTTTQPASPPASSTNDQSRAEGAAAPRQGPMTRSRARARGGDAALVPMQDRVNLIGRDLRHQRQGSASGRGTETPPTTGSQIEAGRPVQARRRPTIYLRGLRRRQNGRPSPQRSQDRSLPQRSQDSPQRTQHHNGSPLPGPLQSNAPPDQAMQGADDLGAGGLNSTPSIVTGQSPVTAVQQPPIQVANNSPSPGSGSPAGGTLPPEQEEEQTMMQRALAMFDVRPDGQPPPPRSPNQPPSSRSPTQSPPPRSPNQTPISPSSPNVSDGKGSRKDSPGHQHPVESPKKSPENKKGKGVKRSRSPENNDPAIKKRSSSPSSKRPRLSDNKEGESSKPGKGGHVSVKSEAESTSGELPPKPEGNAVNDNQSQEVKRHAPLQGESGQHEEQIGQTTSPGPTQRQRQRQPLPNEVVEQSEQRGDQQPGGDSAPIVSQVESRTDQTGQTGRADVGQPPHQEGNAGPPQGAVIPRLFIEGHPCAVLHRNLAHFRVERATHDRPDQEDEYVDPLQHDTMMEDTNVLRAISSVTEAVTELGRHVYSLLPPNTLQMVNSEAMAEAAQPIGRAGNTAFVPWTSGLHTSLFVLVVKEYPEPNTGEVIVLNYDSIHESGHSTQAEAQTVVGRILEAGWNEGSNANGQTWRRESFARVNVQRPPMAGQQSQVTCGQHTIFSAWMRALGLQWRESRRYGRTWLGEVESSRYNSFIKDGEEIIRLVVQGFMDAQTIHAFLDCYGVARHGQGLTAGRNFRRTRRFANANQLAQHVAYVRLRDGLDRIRRTRDPALPDLDTVLQDMGEATGDYNLLADPPRMPEALYREWLVFYRPDETATENEEEGGG